MTPPSIPATVSEPTKIPERPEMYLCLWHTPTTRPEIVWRGYTSPSNDRAWVEGVARQHVGSVIVTIPGSAPPPSPSTGSQSDTSRRALVKCAETMGELQATIDQLRAELEKVKARVKELDNDDGAMLHAAKQHIDKIAAELTALKAQSGREGLVEAAREALHKLSVIHNMGSDRYQSGTAIEALRAALEPYSPTPAPKPQPANEPDPLGTLLRSMRGISNLRERAATPSPSPTQPPKAQTGLKWGCHLTEKMGGFDVESPTKSHWLGQRCGSWNKYSSTDTISPTLPGFCGPSARSDALSALEACDTPPPDFDEFASTTDPDPIAAFNKSCQPKPSECSPSPSPDFADEEARRLWNAFVDTLDPHPTKSPEEVLVLIAASIRKAVERGKAEAWECPEPGPEDEMKPGEVENIVAAVMQQTRTEALSATKGCVIDCTGEKPVVRKVLGTLPVTKDGCLLGDSADVYTDVGGGLIEKARTGVKIAWLDGVTGEEGQCPAEECAATKEAAQESSRDGRVGK